MEERLTRKLAVILHADVVGSTSLVQLNETLAHERIQDTFRRFAETIVSHGGIAHEIRGDALVAGFAKASDAVSASLEFQIANFTHNEQLAGDLRPELRVGIAMGEVVVADNTVTGQGVVLAQRLEQLAVPGGVCIQGAAYETVPKRLPFDYENLGERALKGFEEPVRVYAVSAKVTVTDPERPTKASVSAVRLSDRPSIAVLPFENMSDNREQEYFSDGITEDIITELSRFRELLVIARNSAFSYKGRAVKVQEIGRDLGVGYVLEGSVRRSGERVRITAQLIEAASGTHIWAERFDRTLQDIFDLQDEITETIVKQLPVRLQGALVERGRRKPSSNLTAYDHFLQGRWLLEQSFFQSAEGLQQLGKAVAIDPHYAQAHAFIALAHAYSVFTFSPIGTDPIAKALESIEQALQSGEGDHLVHTVAGEVFLCCGDFDRAMNQSNKAVGLNPNDIFTLQSRGSIMAYCGDAASAIDLFAKVELHDPIAPEVYFEVLAESYYMTGDYAKALAVYQGWSNPPVHSHTHVAACHAQLGQMDEAHAAVQAFKEKCPQGADFDYYATAHSRICKRPQDAEHWLDGYRKAGLMN